MRDFATPSNYYYYYYYYYGRRALFRPARCQFHQLGVSIYIGETSRHGNQWILLGDFRQNRCAGAWEKQRFSTTSDRLFFWKTRWSFKSSCKEHIGKHISPEEHDENYLGILVIENRQCFKRGLCGNQVRIIFCMFSCDGFLAFMLLCLANKRKTSSTRLIKHMVHKRIPQQSFEQSSLQAVSCSRAFLVDKLAWHITTWSSWWDIAEVLLITVSIGWQGRLWL